MNFDNYTGEKLLERRIHIDRDGIGKKDFLSLSEMKAEQISSPDRIESIIDNKGVVKLGIDPTGADIHLGHAVTLNMLRLAQNVGLHPVFIIGTLTAKVGDPTGRVDSRPILTDEDIKNNIKSYQKQAGTIIDLSKGVDIVHNDELQSDVGIAELMSHFSHVSMSSLLQRNDFRSRQQEGDGVTMAEVSYPLLMGMDSIKLTEKYGEDLVELGGKDQLLNFQLSKEMMKKGGLTPQEYITSVLLPGTNSIDSKMSKSLGNYIGLDESTENIYGKVMGIPDDLIYTYFAAFADLFPIEEKDLRNYVDSNPYEAKRQLAYFISGMLTDEGEAQVAADGFTQKFSNQDYDAVEYHEITFSPGSSVVDLLADTGKFKSKNAIRTLLNQGSIKIIVSGELTKEKLESETLEDTVQVKIGKKNPQFFTFSKI